MNKAVCFNFIQEKKENQRLTFLDISNILQIDIEGIKITAKFQNGDNVDITIVNGKAIIKPIKKDIL